MSPKKIGAVVLIIAICTVLLKLIGGSSHSDNISETMESNIRNSFYKFGMMTRQQRIQDAFNYYKQLGFYKDTQLTVEDVTEKINKENQFSQFFDPFSPSEENYYFAFGDLFVWGLDNSKTWFKDLEMDVVEGNNAYVKTLKEWSDISQGEFILTDVHEEWKSTEGPVNVYFTLNNKQYKYKLSKQSDFINMEILKDINKLIDDTGFQYYSIAMDQSVFVVLLTENEKERIESDRAVPFDLPNRNSAGTFGSVLLLDVQIYHGTRFHYILRRY
ncbi:hypothetical protein GZH47_22215 [Paenibacillus rhizovicinus]|uniref:Uncharacterized protein n=1 Tax=Paenibacillus rhizovicinus TaxID=2704463 RepID=A0A6C0P695_9BACL|nr:hypothetical protein [Paenibacillus rhizovicinus]QHW33233.1 hypothetical protein GZH47_22215 [Paenibacillus rhizovicinus]